MLYYDSNALIVQKDLDGGDTAQREGSYWFARALYESCMHTVIINNRKLSFDDVLTLLQVSPGVFIRNPIGYNDPKDFSRDQTIPLIIAMGEMKKYKELRQLLWQQVKRFTLYQNKDLATPQDWGYYIRSFKAWYLYPVLLVGDIFLLTNSIIRCIKGRDRNDVSDDINHTVALLQAQNHLATPISWLARKVYKWFRPLGGIQAAWDWYFRPETNANPFNELYRQLIERM